MYSKRLWACMLGGSISAAVCLIGRQIVFGFPEISSASIAALVANRLLLGFAIGISGWKLDRFLHGAALGLLFSLSVSIGFLPNSLLGFLLYTLAGTLYGVLIEWLATDVLRAPMRSEWSQRPV